MDKKYLISGLYTSMSGFWRRGHSWRVVFGNCMNGPHQKRDGAAHPETIKVNNPKKRLEKNLSWGSTTR